MKTTDLIDRYEDALVIANVSNFTHFGRTREFHGRVVTVQSREDNTKAKALLETPGQGRVLVVDGAASYARAL
ncbi:MAG: putative 4-hydroxy-4-methyl-2-oxoglutarate aldolase, partial [Pseudomonadales bacterium]|nr:putative 4-hydroxy-4-methyl-2-oxoglutarate aldolase [Pseudomonadales bacterium]